MFPSIHQKLNPNLYLRVVLAFRICIGFYVWYADVHSGLVKIINTLRNINYIWNINLFLTKKIIEEYVHTCTLENP